jgi:hypothetical protein
MGKYLKLFENMTSYEAWKAGEDYVLPNVSYFNTEKAVEYNPFKNEQPVVLKAKFEASNSKYYVNTSLCYNATNVKKLVVDNNVIFDYPDGLPDNAITSYTFETLGEHNVEFTLADTEIQPFMFSESCITEIDLGDQITYIGDEAFCGYQNPTYTSRISGCRYIKCSSKTAPKLGTNVFTYINRQTGGDTYQHCIVEVPEGSNYTSWYEDAHIDDGNTYTSFTIHNKGGILWIGQKQELAASIFSYFEELYNRYNISNDQVWLYTSIVTSSYNHDQTPGTLGIRNSGTVDGEWKEWVDVIANISNDEMYKNVLDKIYYWDECWGYYGKYHIMHYNGPNEPIRGNNLFLTTDGYLYIDAD